MKKLFAYVIAMALASGAMAAQKVELQGVTGVSVTVNIDTALPAGTNTIGGVTMSQGPATSASIIVPSGTVIGITVGGSTVYAGTLIGPLPPGTNSLGTVGLDTGTNSIGKLGSDNDGIDIGNVGLEAGSRQMVVATYGSSIWIDDTDAYSPGDALGGLINFAVGNTYTSFLLHGAVLVDLASQDAHIDVYCFDGTYTPTADDAAFDPADGELADNYITHLHFPASSYETFVDNSVATLHNIGTPVKLSGTGFYCQCVLGAGETPTYSTAADVRVKIHVIPQ